MRQDQDITVHRDNRAPNAVIRREVATVNRAAVGGVAEEEATVDFLLL